MLELPCPGCRAAGQPDLCVHSADDWSLALELARAFLPVTDEPLTATRIWTFIEDAEAIRPLCPPPPWTVRRLDLVGHVEAGCIINEDLVCATVLTRGPINLVPLLRIDPAAQRAQIAGEIAERIHRLRHQGILGRQPDSFFAGAVAAEDQARRYGAAEPGER